MWTCIAADWRFGIGDPTPAGWFATLAYGLAALAAAAVALRGRAIGRERLAWSLAAVALALLAANKQLDLQTLLRGLGRCATAGTRLEGVRYGIKEAVVIALPLLGVAGLTAAWLMLRGTLARTWPIVAGFGLVAAFVVVRAAWLADVYIPIGAQLGYAGLDWLLEFPGPLLILLAALVALRNPPGTGRGTSA